MNILYIITMADGGGAQKYVLELASHFQGVIAAGSEHDYLFRIAEQRGIKSYRLKYLKRNINPVSDMLAFFEIYFLIKKIKPDIVHLNSSKAGFLGSIAAKLAGRKVVFTAHGLFYFYNTPVILKLIYTFLEKLASLFRDFIITVSENDRQNAQKHRLISAKKIINIYYGIRPVTFLSRQEARQKLGLPAEGLILGNIAQYYHRKGLDILLKAIHLLPQNNKLKLVLIGDGPEKTKLKTLSQKLGLENIVIFSGHVPNAAQYLQAFDIFVLSSRREGFPFVLLEALQARTPIIATDVGGNQELIGPAGVIVPSESTLKLSNSIARLINEEDERMNLVKLAGARSFLFSEDNMIQKTENVYSLVAPGLIDSIRSSNSAAS